MQLETVSLTAKEIFAMETAMVKLCQLPFTKFKDVTGCALMFKAYEDKLSVLRKAEAQLQKSFIQYTNSGQPKIDRGEVKFHDGRTSDELEAAREAFLDQCFDLPVHFFKLDELEEFTRVKEMDGRERFKALSAIDLMRLEKILK